MHLETRIATVVEVIDTHLVILLSTYKKVDAKTMLKKKPIDKLFILEANEVKLLDIIKKSQG